MTSRERVTRILNHMEADKVPVDFGGTVVTCLDYKAHKELRKHFGIPDAEDPIIDYTMGTVEPCEELKKRFGSDVRRVSLNSAPPQIENGTYENGFGNILRKADPHLYFETVFHPLQDAAIGDIDGMKLPDAKDESLYHGIRDKARDLYENSPYAIVADFGVPGFYETSQKLRGYENLACDLLINKELLNHLYGRLFELQKDFFSRYLAQVRGYAQVICYADDLGMQDRLQISPETYREMVKPWHKKIFDFIHENADIKIMLHSCGAIFPLIDDLIEAGVDILNPIQTAATGMDPVKLKETFGNRLVFWGGIDEQYILPNGTSDEIDAEVRRVVDAFKAGGGFVLAPSHNIQDDTSPQNVEAMYSAADKYRKY